MKTTYSDGYLDRKYSPAEKHVFLQQRRKELERRAGVPFSVDSLQGHQRFLPALDSRTTQTTLDRSIVDAVSAVLPVGVAEYRTFLGIQEDTRLSLPDIMAASLTLIREGRASVAVNRMGAATFIRGQK